jgi:tetratricopeptide (TPR) repeat protein
VGAAEAQLAVPQTQNLEKLLILNVLAEPASDSLVAIAVIDAVRDRLTAMARYKVMVVPKAKICEALTQSGFPCGALLTPNQAAQLSKALGVNSYNTGRVGHRGGHLVADVKITSGGSGFSSSFTVDGGNPGTPQALGEAIAQRLNTIVRAAEFARSCQQQRQNAQADRALAEARKAFAINPDLTAAHMCVANIREVQHASPDSIIAAVRRALKGDPGNQEAWFRVAQTSLVKGDSVGAFDAYDSLLSYNPGDLSLRKQLAVLLLQHKDHERAERLLREGLRITPGDQQMIDMRRSACRDGGLYACTLEILRAQVTADTTKLSDTTVLKEALANAPAAADTQAFLWWSAQAVKHHPNNAIYRKLRGQAFDLAGQVDSAIAQYKMVVAQNANDVQTSLLIAKTIVDHAVWDTAAARRLQDAKDTAGLRRLRTALVTSIDQAFPYVAAGYTSPDSAFRLNTYVIALSAGTKVAQAGAYDRAFPWLDQLLQGVAQRSPNDTSGPRMAIRSQASFWFIVPALQKLGAEYNVMSKSKSCAQAKDVNDQLQRLKVAMAAGRRLSAAYVDGLQRQYVDQFDRVMPQIKNSFHCSNF